MTRIDLGRGRTLEDRGEEFAILFKGSEEVHRWSDMKAWMPSGDFAAAGGQTVKAMRALAPLDETARGSAFMILASLKGVPQRPDISTSFPAFLAYFVILLVSPVASAHRRHALEWVTWLLLAVTAVILIAVMVWLAASAWRTATKGRLDHVQILHHLKAGEGSPLGSEPLRWREHPDSRPFSASGVLLRRDDGRPDWLRGLKESPPVTKAFVAYVLLSALVEFLIRPSKDLSDAGAIAALAILAALFILGLAAGIFPHRPCKWTIVTENGRMTAIPPDGGESMEAKMEETWFFTWIAWKGGRIRPDLLSPILEGTPWARPEGAPSPHGLSDTQAGISR